MVDLSFLNAFGPWGVAAALVGTLVIQMIRNRAKVPANPASPVPLPMPTPDAPAPSPAPAKPLDKFPLLSALWQVLQANAKAKPVTSIKDVSPEHLVALSAEVAAAIAEKKAHVEDARGQLDAAVPVVSLK